MAKGIWDDNDASGFSLDDWLRADMAGTVCGVKGGDDAISDEQWASLAEAADARRKRLAKQARRTER